MRFPRPRRRRKPTGKLLSTDPRVVFGQIVGVDVPPHADLHEFADDLARQAGRKRMERIDRTRARGLWTADMERMWATIGDLHEGDPRIEALVHELWAEVQRIERENEP